MKVPATAYRDPRRGGSRRWSASSAARRSSSRFSCDLREPGDYDTVEIAAATRCSSSGGTTAWPVRS